MCIPNKLTHDSLCSHLREALKVVRRRKKEPVQDLVIGDHKSCVWSMPPLGPERETGTIPLVLTSVTSKQLQSADDDLCELQSAKKLVLIRKQRKFFVQRTKTTKSTMRRQSYQASNYARLATSCTSLGASPTPSPATARPP